MSRPDCDVHRLLRFAASLKIKKTAYMKITLSRKELGHLSSKSATYVGPALRSSHELIALQVSKTVCPQAHEVGTHSREETGE